MKTRIDDGIMSNDGPLVKTIADPKEFNRVLDYTYKSLRRKV